MHLLYRIALLGLCIVPVGIWAQFHERPGSSLDNPVDSPHDLSGWSIKHPRIRVVHTEDPEKAGGSSYLQIKDPWLGFQWGRGLFLREFRSRDGVLDPEAGKLTGPILPDGTTRMGSRSHATSCAVCHNHPFGDAGSGMTMAKNGGSGRNTPHMFGAGLVEMIGQQVRATALKTADADGNGWISSSESVGKRLLVSPTASGEVIDFGAFADSDNDGWPDLNPVIHPLFVDAQGKWLATADDLNDPRVAGYLLEVQVFGHGRLRAPRRPPLPTTLRAFAAATFDTHLGMPAYDPTTLNDPDGDGYGEVSNAGALQCVAMAGRDRGRIVKNGISYDDPDRDGFVEEISEGELDMIEWYNLNHPPPGRGEITRSVKRGERLFRKMGCTSCHVSDWKLLRDRRFFDMIVEFNPERLRMEGRLVVKDTGLEPSGDREEKAHVVYGVYSDFRYHEMGAAFAQIQFDGSVVRRWRTTPLWGVGSTAPYGHDGASLTLDEVIRRHGGGAAAARERYEEARPRQREAVLAFLRSLVLYPVTRIPCDINGDGEISDNYKVAGRDTGYERLNPEWLFREPGRIEGEIVGAGGSKIRSDALVNIDQAYGLRLPWLVDKNRNGFPDRRDLD